jgi:GNAT superfamily N-acetyltransferase
MLHIRTANSMDAPLIATYVRELAEYEKLATEARANAADFAAELSAPDPVIHVLLAEWDGQPAGFALYFFSFSTFLGRRGLYLEDLFVRPHLRGHGIGHALLVTLAKEAKARDCGRMEWAVLNWNEPAIRFYASLGAKPMTEWTVNRLTRAEIDALSEATLRTPS